MDEDLALVRRCQEGDLGAFQELVERYEGRIYTLACSIVGDREAAQDAAQETFIRAYQALFDFRIESGFYTWLYRIAVNVCLNAARKERRRPDNVSLETLMESGRIASERLFGSSPLENDIERAQLQETIQAVLNSLSADHRAVVVLKDIEDLSQEEIAEVLGCSVGTVKSRLSRARERLMDLLRPVYDECMGREPTRSSLTS